MISRTLLAALALAFGTLQASPPSLTADLDAIFDDPVLARALVSVRVDALAAAGPTRVYDRNGARLVMPASNMKILTLAVAAERLGWDYTFDTRLETTGKIAAGVLKGDVIVTGTGDPTMTSMDFGPAPQFAEWADALWKAGVRRIDGRVLGDDRAFDPEGRGAGWAWDTLPNYYAAPVGALTYNENAVVIRVQVPARMNGTATVEVTPAGHRFQIANEIKTGDPLSRNTLEVVHVPGTAKLTVRGNVPAGSGLITRALAVDRPTMFFAEALRLAIAARGIPVRGGAWAVGDLPEPPAADGRTFVAERRSAPLSALAGYFMKTSQNLYAETLLRALGRTKGEPATAVMGRDLVKDTLQAWGVAPDGYVMADGSGLSRYDYVTAETIVAILEHVHADERLRGPFLASLPVSGHDGTLETHMRMAPLEGIVQAKTGTIANVRALSGFLETASGERLAFSIIVNNFTALSAEVDAVVERALARLTDR